MRITMFISSYFPLYVMLLIQNSNNYNTIDKIIGLIYPVNYKMILFIGVLLFFILISFISIIDIKRTKGNEYYSINKIHRPDDTVISYMMTYIIPLLTTNDLSNQTILINIFLFSLIGYMYIRLNLIYLNPLWSVFGYIMYKTDTDMILITDIPYFRIKSLNNSRVKGRLLGSNIYLIQKRENETI